MASPTYYGSEDSNFPEPQGRLNAKEKKITEYQSWLDKAIAKGTIDTQWSNVSVTGASGAGKTSVMNMLLLNDPITVHHSTPILENFDVCVAEEEALKEESDNSVSDSSTSESESLPESDSECQADVQPVAEEERKMSQRVLLADDGKDHLWKVAEKDTLHKKLAEGIVTLMNSEEGEAEAEAIAELNPKHCQFPPHYPPAKRPPKLSDTEPIMQSSIIGPDFTPPAYSFFEMTVSKQILELLPQLTTQHAEFGRIHFINLLDSGGQASFMDIAPALTRYNSINLIVHKLNERLDATANFFYCVNGKRIGEEKRRLTNAQLLKGLFSFRTGVKRPNLEGLVGVEIVGEALLLVLGTHYDIYLKMKKEGILEEKLEQKNQRLSIELGVFDDLIVPYESLKGQSKKKRKGKGKEASSVEFIFPINTLSRKERELKIARHIRRLASRCYIRAKVPVRWYLIQIEINELKCSGKDVVVIGKVLRIGLIFQMCEEEVRASLKYFHELTVCLYFHEVLPDIVFLTPQCLFKKLSQIVAVSLMEHTSIVKGSISAQLCHEGVFTKALLDYFPDDYERGVFTPDDFLKLMEHLLIITQLPDGKSYFMPSVLECVDDPLEGLGEVYFKVAPLCFTWNDSVPNGLFPSLVQYLQGPLEPDFKPDMGGKNYRNKITLRYPEALAKVVLFEQPGFIGVAHSGRAVDSSPIRTAICKGIRHVVKTFHWEEEIAEPVESYLCNMQHTEKTAPHIYDISRQYLSCPLDYDKRMKLDYVYHLSWQEAQSANQTSDIHVAAQFDSTVSMCDLTHGGIIVDDRLFLAAGGKQQYFKWEECGLLLHVPENPMSPLSFCEVRVSALAGGDFIFPDDYELVSAVYAVTLSQSLQQAVVLELQHCVDLQIQEHVDSLSFAVASPLPSPGSYTFIPIKGGRFSISDRYGSIEASESLCYCIMMREYVHGEKKKNADSCESQSNNTEKGQEDCSEDYRSGKDEGSDSGSGQEARGDGDSEGSSSQDDDPSDSDTNSETKEEECKEQDLEGIVSEDTHEDKIEKHDTSVSGEELKRQEPQIIRSEDIPVASEIIPQAVSTHHENQGSKQWYYCQPFVLKCNNEQWNAEVVFAKELNVLKKYVASKTHREMDKQGIQCFHLNKKYLTIEIPQNNVSAVGWTVVPDLNHPLQIDNEKIDSFGKGSSMQPVSSMYSAFRESDMSDKLCVYPLTISDVDEMRMELNIKFHSSQDSNFSIEKQKVLALEKNEEVDSTVTSILDKRPLLKHAVNNLRIHSADWSSIGLQLDVPPDERDGLRRDTGLNNIDRLEKVIEYWLKTEYHTPVTWGELIEVLKDLSFTATVRNIEEFLKTKRVLETYKTC